MRISDKILIGTLCFIVIAGAAVHVALYMKFHSGDLTSEVKMRKQQFNSYSLPPLRYVKIEGLQNLRIIPASKPGLEINKNAVDRMHFEIRGDSLLLTGDINSYEATKNSFGPIVRDQEIDLFLNSLVPVAVAYSNLQVSGSRDSILAPDYQLSVSNSRLQLGEFIFFDSLPSYFNRVHISASNQSEIRFTKKIDSLYIDLTNSLLSDEDWGRFGHIQIDLNGSSHIHLDGYNIARMLNQK
jgi:hypothetical protein